MTSTETPSAETPSAETPSAETPSAATPSTETPSAGTPGTPSTAMPSGPYPRRRLFRSRDRVLGGVAAGIADYLGLPPALVRLLFVVAGFMGWGLLLYPALWIVIPRQ